MPKSAAEAANARPRSAGPPAIAGISDYIAHLSSWAQDLLARGERDMPEHAGQMATDIQTATRAAEAGDLKALFDTLWDWEATLDEAAAGSLTAARARFRKRPRVGRRPKEAAAGLWQEVKGQGSDEA